MRTILSSSALAALLVCTACDQPMDQRAERDRQATPPTEQAMNEPAPQDSTTPQPYPFGGNTLQPDQTASAIPLSDVENPAQTLANASVKDAKGAAIGEVASVNVGSDGKVQMVSVETGSRTVRLEATGMKYAKAENAVISNRTKEEIEAMP